MAKNRELAKTEFYKKELLKEKQRNQALRERNSMLKSKVLKLIEVVQVHLLEENQYTAELEVAHLSFFHPLTNQALRSSKCLSQCRIKHFVDCSASMSRCLSSMMRR
jgi:hypothetical protein